MVEGYQRPEKRQIKTNYGTKGPYESRRRITIYPKGRELLAGARLKSPFLFLYNEFPPLKPKHLAHRKSRKNLERNLSIAISTTALLSSATFLSTNLTGLAISNLNQTDTNIVGTIFFVFGVLGILIGLRKR